MRSTKDRNILLTDDGGTGKSEDRLRRRKQHRRQRFFAWGFGLLFIIICYNLFPSSKEKDKRQLVQDTFRRIRGPRGGHKSEQNDIVLQKIENDSKYRWVDDRNLPPPDKEDAEEWWKEYQKKFRSFKNKMNSNKEFKVGTEEVGWLDNIAEADMDQGPAVDYTELNYEYPKILWNPDKHGHYPPLEPLVDILKQWPQDDIDTPPQPFHEKLQHFDFMDVDQMKAALSFRDAELPFKVYNIPEIDLATLKWTDDYVAYNFDHAHARRSKKNKTREKIYGKIPPMGGHSQLSVDNFFAFFTQAHWYVELMGSPPTLDINGHTYEQWAKHARYADSHGIPPNTRHIYWQSGIGKGIRFKPKQQLPFVARDLPSFSSVDPTFFSFKPKEEKGVQCRFGERGIVAATHYDGGRNMIAMITGAKRYILSPPNQCQKLGIMNKPKHAAFRHSLLNFGHINLLDSEDPETKAMPKKEREWLEIARSSLTIETVLKAGEVLYIPSHWFHYIVSLQKSAQCNTRSGRDIEGNPNFGNAQTVQMCGEQEI